MADEYEVKQEKEYGLIRRQGIFKQGFFIMPMAIMRSELSDGAKLTYGVLSSLALGENAISPQQDEIAQIRCVRADTISSNISELADKGWIRIKRKTTNRGIINTYYLMDGIPDKSKKQSTPNKTNNSILTKETKESQETKETKESLKLSKLPNGSLSNLHNSRFQPPKRKPLSIYKPEDFLDQEKIEAMKPDDMLYYFCIKYREKTGERYMISFGRDKKAFKEVCSNYPNDKVLDLVDSFFDIAKKDKKCWWKDKLNIPIFRSVVPEMIVKITRAGGGY